ncbi:hypothetical protein [Xylella fastidiosa]|uniref:hypothetical protein n=1 Tax=Xylella fastidiosa TaxID=2371 RepID=UPI00398478EE
MTTPIRTFIHKNCPSLERLPIGIWPGRFRCGLADRSTVTWCLRTSFFPHHENFAGVGGYMESAMQKVMGGSRKHDGNFLEGVHPSFRSSPVVISLYAAEGAVLGAPNRQNLAALAGSDIRHNFMDH